MAHRDRKTVRKTDYHQPLEYSIGRVVHGNTDMKRMVFAIVKLITCGLRLHTQRSFDPSRNAEVANITAENLAFVLTGKQTDNGAEVTVIGIGDKSKDAIDKIGGQQGGITITKIDDVVDISPPEVKAHVRPPKPVFGERRYELQSGMEGVSVFLRDHGMDLPARDASMLRAFLNKVRTVFYVNYVNVKVETQKGIRVGIITCQSYLGDELVFVRSTENGFVFETSGALEGQEGFEVCKRILKP